MDKRDLIKLLFDRGNEAGFKEMEVFIQKNNTLELMVFKGELDKYSKAVEEGLSFRGVYNGKMGYSYTEKLDETSIDMLINEAKSNALVIDSEDDEVIFHGSKEYKDIKVYNDESKNVSVDEKIEFIKTLEREAFRVDERVKAVNFCLFGEEVLNTTLVNNTGLDLEDKINMYYAYISVMVKDKEDIKTGVTYLVSNDFKKFNPKELAVKAVKEALSMLKAESINSDDYPVILRNNVSANILNNIASIFSAENVQKGMSLLKGKVDEKIASDILTIVDDPFMEDGAATKTFDGEGVATRYKKIVDKGYLKTYLHNMKTAKKEGVKSTGNAYKPSYKSSIEIAPSNMYIENGDSKFEDIIKGTEKGLLITDIQGIHAGLNAVSGDFSLSANGYEVINGEIVRPVNQITIAGNYFEVLRNVEEIGNDLKFALPTNGYVGSPSLKIKSLSVAGK